MGKFLACISVRVYSDAHKGKKLPNKSYVRDFTLCLVVVSFGSVLLATVSSSNNGNFGAFTILWQHTRLREVGRYGPNKEDRKAHQTAIWSCKKKKIEFGMRAA